MSLLKNYKKKLKQKKLEMEMVKGEKFPLMIRDSSYDIKDNNAYSEIFNMDQEDKYQGNKIERRDTYGLF